MQDSQAPKYKSFAHLFKVVLNIGLSSFYFGYSNSNFNSINFDDVVRIYNIGQFSRSSAQGWITGCVSWAGCLGALLSLYLINSLSRSQLVKYLDYFIIINTLVMQIPNIWVLIGCRIVQGICIGLISSVAPLYIRELAPNQIAGTLAPINQIMIVVGVTFPYFFSYVLSLVFPVEIYWRIIFGFPLVTVTLQLYNFACRYPYQTPKYYLSRDKLEEARELTSIFYKQQYVEEVLSEVKESINKKRVRELSTGQRQLKEMKDGKELRESLLQHERQITNKSVFKNSTLAIIMAFHLSIEQQMSGQGVMIAYSGQLMLLTVPLLEKIFPIFLNLTAVIGAIGSILSLKYCGRKGSLIIGSILLAACFFVLAFNFSTFNLDNPEKNNFLSKCINVACIVLIRLIFSLSLGPIVWVYVTQIVQPNITPYAITLNWISVSIVNTSFPILTEYFGGNPCYIFYFFGAYTFTSGFVNKIWLVQTTDKTQQEIRQQFDNKWK